jgi:hypothetical protein
MALSWTRTTSYSFIPRSFFYYYQSVNQISFGLKKNKIINHFVLRLRLDNSPLFAICRNHDHDQIEPDLQVPNSSFITWLFFYNYLSVNVISLGLAQRRKKKIVNHFVLWLRLNKSPLFASAVGNAYWDHS